jgi:hypothetical protein
MGKRAGPGTISARARRDNALKVLIKRVFFYDNYVAYNVRKFWWQS